MKTIKNYLLLVYCNAALRSTFNSVAEEYAAQYGKKNVGEKLFISLSPEEEKAFIVGIRSKDKAEQKQAQLTRVNAGVIGVIGADGVVDYKDPQLVEVLLSVLGNKKNRVFEDVRYQNGCILTGKGKAFAIPSVKAAEPAKAPEAAADGDKEKETAKKTKDAKDKAVNKKADKVAKEESEDDQKKENGDASNPYYAMA
jgi:hypothetical protein